MSNLSQPTSQPAAAWLLVFNKKKILKRVLIKMYIFKFAYRKVRSFSGTILKQGSYLNPTINLFAIIPALYV